MTDNSEEIGLWLDALWRPSQHAKGSSVIDFYQSVMVAAAHDLYSIVDEIVDVSTKEVEGKMEEVQKGCFMILFGTFDSCTVMYHPGKAPSDSSSTFRKRVFILKKFSNWMIRE